MRTVGSFVWALLLSMFLSQLVAQQLAVYFHAREEFIAVIMLLVLFALICILVLGAVYYASDKTRPLDVAAMSLAGLILVVTFAIMLFGMAVSGWKPPGIADWQITVEIVFPALIAVLVQWWLVRRRRIKVASPNSLPGHS